MRKYIRDHQYCIEEKARRMFGETEVFQFGGYLLQDGSMLNFSYSGYQRDEDHRIIGYFFSNAQGTKAMLKFMRRGNVRIMCHKDSYSFEYIAPLTKEQKYMIREACKEAEELGYCFTLEKDDAKGRPVKQWFDSFGLIEAFQY